MLRRKRNNEDPRLGSERRREWLAALVMLSLAASPAGVRIVAASRSQQASGGTMTEAFGVVVDTFNPAQTGYTADGWVVRDIFDSLVYITPPGKVTPWLATSWTITNGGKTYTFYLRHDVTFQDGTPFDANAVVYNVHYFENPTTQAKVTSVLGDYLSAKALSKYVFQYNIKTPTARSSSTGEAGIRHAVAHRPPEVRERSGQSPGRHRAIHVPELRPAHHPHPGAQPRLPLGPAAIGMTGPAKLDKIVFNVITQPSVLADELQTGQAQYAASAPSAAIQGHECRPELHGLPHQDFGSGRLYPDQ